MNQEGTSRPMTPQQPETPAAAPEEVLVSDARGALTPAEMVERKLAALLQSTALPVSRFQAGPRRALS
jgi:hypothetical protein